MKNNNIIYCSYNMTMLVSNYLTNTPQQNGREFELIIHNLLLQTKCNVYSERYIRKRYSHITGIDHILEYNNLMFCFQDKWLKYNISNRDINHFNAGIQDLKNIHQNYHFIAIYLSKTPLSKEAQKIAYQYNIISINSFDINIIIRKLMEFLYGFTIYCYDNDNDIIMI